jgi:RHS repeat-associated protein
MVSATVSSVTTTFAYRGDGLRDSKTTGGNTTTFTWDVAAGLPVVLDDGKQYLYGAGLVAQKQSGSWYYYLADGLGSTMKTVDASGNVVNAYEYDIYGAKTSSSGSQANEFDFAGQQTDGSTGLQHLRARYYDPATGTFASRDPLLSAPSWMQHPFGYVAGNPTNLQDPSGTCIFGLPCPDTRIERYCYNPAHWNACSDARTWVDSAALVASRYFPDERGYAVENSLRDAFRHCLWSGWIAAAHGGSASAKITTYYEDEDFSGYNAPEAHAMDLLNNAEGRLIGEYVRNNPNTDYVGGYHQRVADMCYSKAIGEELRYLDGPCGDCRDIAPVPFARRREPISRFKTRLRTTRRWTWA